MQVAHRWSDRNLSRMELVVVLLIIAVFIGVFARYTLTVFTRAEQNLVNSTVININTALHYRAAMAVMQGKYEALNELLNANPMEEMQQVTEINTVVDDNEGRTASLLSGLVVPPGNYGNVIYSDSDLQIEEGNWYFNQAGGYLVYFINNKELFQSDLDGRPRLRFKTVMKFDDINENGSYEPGLDEFSTMKLESIDNYQWGQ